MEAWACSTQNQKTDDVALLNIVSLHSLRNFFPWIFQPAFILKVTMMGAENCFLKWVFKQLKRRYFGQCQNRLRKSPKDAQPGFAAIETKTCVPSMIHSATSTVPPVGITIVTRKLGGGWTDVQTTRAKILITTGLDCGSASWINDSSKYTY